MLVDKEKLLFHSEHKNTRPDVAASGVFIPISSIYPVLLKLMFDIYCKLLLFILYYLQKEKDRPQRTVKTLHFTHKKYG